MFEFLRDETFLEQRSKGHHYYFNDVGMVLPSWQEIIEGIDYNENLDVHVKYPLRGSVIYYHSHHLPCVRDFFQYCKHHAPEYKLSCHTYICFSTKSQQLGRHFDGTDVIFVQAIGKTKWTIDDSGKSFVYELKPNSAVYVPKKMYHNAVSLTPRVGLSFGIS